MERTNPERFSGPTYFNMDGIECPNKCEVESYTIKIHRKPTLMRRSPYIYKIFCNGCGATVVELLKGVDDFSKE